MERMRAEEGVEEEEDDEEEGLPFLLKDWRDSCLVMASTTVPGTFTGNKKHKDRNFVMQAFIGFKRLSFDFHNKNLSWTPPVLRMLKAKLVIYIRKPCSRL